MRLGIMQPYFFPYIGYMSLIKHVDMFILFDTAQFIRHGWIERNRILKPSGGWQYMGVPLKKHEQKIAIRDIEINNQIEWKDKILAQLVHYKRAPYYYKVINMLQNIFDDEYSDIVMLNKVSLEKTCKYLGINTPILIFSQMDIKIDCANNPDEWALNICKAIEGVDGYWNPPGGKSFFDTNKYLQQGIDIQFQEVNIRAYPQGKNAFEGGLSIIDVMMYNSPTIINDMLDDYRLI